MRGRRTGPLEKSCSTEQSTVEQLVCGTNESSCRRSRERRIASQLESSKNKNKTSEVSRKQNMNDGKMHEQERGGWQETRAIKPDGRSRRSWPLGLGRLYEVEIRRIPRRCLLSYFIFSFCRTFQKMIFFLRFRIRTCIAVFIFISSFSRPHFPTLFFLRSCPRLRLMQCQGARYVEKDS